MKRAIATTLNKQEQKSFRAIKRYVKSFCGEVSDAEVLRFLIRNFQDFR